MQIGLNAGIFPATWTPQQKVDAAARVGATGFEVNIDANQLWTQRLDSSARQALRQQAQAAQVTITSVCLNAHWIFNLTSPDRRIRDLGVSLILDAINLAVDLDATAVLIPGCDQDESPANKWELFRDGVMQGIARAEQAGVSLALEAVGKPFLFNTAHLLAMIEACGASPALGIYLDVGNSTSGGMDPASEVRAAQGRATLAHVKDWNPQQPSERRLGAGAVNFATSLAALSEIGYERHLIVELPPDPGDPEAVARHAVGYLAQQLS